MQTITKLCLIALAMTVAQAASLPSRQRRQAGFAWDDSDSEIAFRPPRQSPQLPQNAAGPTTPGTTTTTPSAAFSACIRACATTPEYNPVCGSDRVSYSNESRLKCANRCGLSVTKVFNGSCSPL